MTRRHLALALLLAFAGGSGYATHRFRRMVDAQIPKFVPLPEGPRAPSASALGFPLGRMTFPAAEAWAKEKGVACRDKGMAALMREGIAAQIAAQRAAGEWALTTRAYGFLNPHGRNPQIRYSCEDLPSTVLTDRPRTPSTGRVLFVFDAVGLPLRHVSFMRTHQALDQARADLQETVAAFTAQLGEPTQLPTLSAPLAGSPSQEFEVLRPTTFQWRFADVVAEVTLLNTGTRGFNITEQVEVPWPVRSDAPALKVL